MINEDNIDIIGVNDRFHKATDDLCNEVEKLLSRIEEEVSKKHPELSSYTLVTRHSRAFVFVIECSNEISNAMEEEINMCDDFAYAIHDYILIVGHHRVLKDWDYVDTIILKKSKR